MRRLIASLSLAAALLTGAAASAAEPEAQEVPEVPEAPPAENPASDESAGEVKLLRLYAEATAWFSQPVGGDDVYATEIDTTLAIASRTRSQEFGTNDRLRWRAGAVVRGDVGAFVLTYWGAAQQDPVSILVPGRFVIGEHLAFPGFAGISDDGLADGVVAYSRTATRDLRLDFVRDAFRTGRMSAKWLAGIRFVDVLRRLDAVYYALAPDLPPLIDGTGEPATSLFPQADTVGRESAFSGRGVEAGFEATYAVLPQLHLEGGFVYAVLRGDGRASYVSTTNFYTLADSATGDETYLSPSEFATTFGDPANFPFINQRSQRVGIRDSGASASASVLEANLGFRWQAWRTLEVLGGIRQTRYQDAVIEIVPTNATMQSAERRTSSLGYEGFYLGVAYTY